MSSSPKAPKASAEERQLQLEQTQLLRDQRGMLQQQLRTQDLLAPFIYQEMGLKPKFSTPRGAPDTTAIDAQIAQLSAQIGGLPAGKGGLFSDLRSQVEGKLATLQQQRAQMLDGVGGTEII